MTEPSVIAPAPARPFLAWVEAARTLLMGGVVLVHVNILIGKGDVTSWWPGREWSCLGFGIMVPSFFLISGMVLGLSDPPSAPFAAGPFLRRKLGALLLPWLAWNAIGVGLHVLLGVRGGPPWDLWLRLFTGYWQLYFVCALLQYFLVYALVRRYLGGRGLAVAVISTGLINAAFYGLASLLLWTKIRPDGFFEDYLDRTFPAWCFFFFLGVWLGRSERARAAVVRYWWVFALLTLGAFQLFLFEVRRVLDEFLDTPILQFLGGGFPFQVLGALAYVGFFGWLGQRAFARNFIAALMRLAPLSLGVYLSHAAILMLLWHYWKGEGGPARTSISVPSLWLWSWALALLATVVGRHLWWPGRVLFAGRRVPAPVAPPVAPPVAAAPQAEG